LMRYVLPQFVPEITMLQICLVALSNGVDPPVGSHVSL